MKEKLKIAMFHSERSAVGYYRLWQPAKYLEKLGYAEVRMPPQKGRDDDKLSIDNGDDSFASYGRWADIIVFQRIDNWMQLSVFEALREHFKKPIIFEVDDNLYAIPKWHNFYPFFRKKSPNDLIDHFWIRKDDVWKFKRVPGIIQTKELKDGRVLVIKQKPGMDGIDSLYTLEQALKSTDAVTVTTENLRSVYGKLNPKTYVLPNCIDFDIWDKLPPVRKKKQIIIGWAGGAQHFNDLKMIVPVISRILEKYPNVRFHWSNCYVKELGYLKRKFPKRLCVLHHCPIYVWPEYYARWNFDIAIAPLENIEFNKYKSNLKWLENSARKIPTVASPMPPYDDINQGETGFLCDKTNEWVATLSFLIENEEFCRKIGQQAYEYTREHFNIERKVYKWFDTYKEVLENYGKENVDSASNKEARKPESTSQERGSVKEQHQPELVAGKS